MASIFSSISTPFPTLIPFSPSFPLRPIRQPSLRLSKQLISISFSFSYNYIRNSTTKAAYEGGENMSELTAGNIVLDVRGMACEGCVTSVKNILESQPHVLSASVDLAKATAIIWPAVEAMSVQDWQTTLGKNLAKHLTSCGFDSNLQSWKATRRDIPS